jgi:PDZ domain
MDDIIRNEVHAMDPLPGQLYVEYSKDGGDGETKTAAESGLDVTKKAGYGDRIYLSRVAYPASSKLHVGDRLVALNGRRVEKFGGDLDAIRKTMTNGNVVRLLVDPTMIK